LKKLLADFGFAEECPANHGMRVFKGTADDSPTPWGDGRVGELFQIVAAVDDAGVEQ
jgi:hypothetical protein